MTYEKSDKELDFPVLVRSLLLECVIINFLDNEQYGILRTLPNSSLWVVVVPFIHIVTLSPGWRRRRQTWPKCPPCFRIIYSDFFSCSRLHQFRKESSTRKTSGICVDFGESLERRHSDRGSPRIGKDVRSRDWSKKSQCERSIDYFKKGKEYIFPKRLRTPRTHSKTGTDHRDRRPEGVEDESEEPRSTEPTDDTEARRDLWSIQGDFTYRHHNEPRLQHYVPKDLLKYTGVTKSTHTNLDVMQEKRIDDYWNVDDNRSLSESWTGFTKFSGFKEEPPKRFMWFRRDWQTFRRLRDQSMCGLKYWPKLVESLIRRKTKGQTRSPNSRMIEKNERYLLYWSRRRTIIGDRQEYEVSWIQQVTNRTTCTERSRR